MPGNNDNRDRPQPPVPRRKWDTVSESIVVPISQKWRHVVRATESEPPPAPSSLPPLMPGMRLGHYQLVTPIAKGGMAMVWVAWRARRQKAREVVALKVLLPHLAGDAGFVKMFLDEARLLMRIEHANVVRIRDVGTDGGLPHVALEWVDGDSLSSLLKALGSKKKDLPLSFALRVVGECCLGLYAAHELTDPHGRRLEVVHRDVSPANIMLSTTGDVKLIDFGVAKAVDRLADQTRSGVLKGKISYMSPEQLLRGDVDRRSDIWATGVVLYRLVAGRMPYDGDVAQVLRQLRHGHPIAPLPANTPRAVSEVVHRAMAREPEDRFQTASEMRQAIQYAYAEVCAPVPKDQFGRFVVTHLGLRIAERRQALARALAEPSQH
jgi:eukaryotic-like serine/threonine-protein kinase